MNKKKEIKKIYACEEIQTFQRKNPLEKQKKKKE